MQAFDLPIKLLWATSLSAAQEGYEASQQRRYFTYQDAPVLLSLQHF